MIDHECRCCGAHRGTLPHIVSSVTLVRCCGAHRGTLAHVLSSVTLVRVCGAHRGTLPHVLSSVTLVSSMKTHVLDTGLRQCSSSLVEPYCT